MPRRFRRIVVGMSGGVDSSVAAALLRDQGYEVVGVALRLKANEPDSASDDLIAAARAVADHLGISLRVVDRVRCFREEVLRPSWEEYARGRTPNPCVVCNPAIKFDALMEVAREVEADWVATGHYTRVVREPNAAPRLARGRDLAKDQSYFLFALTPEHLARTIFPLGDRFKAEVCRMAHELELPVAGVESQDACVVGLGETLPEFLCATFDGAPVPGDIVSTDGVRLGTHDGFHRFTVGQRRGVGIAVGMPAWVRDIDAATGTVTMTTEPNDLQASALTASGMIWHEARDSGGTFACQVQVRYGHQPVRAVAHAGPTMVRIDFETPVRAVTPGQAVVLYDDDRVIGGGWIDAAMFSI